MAFLTYGQVASDGVEPHDDYLAEFPFLGLPNTQAQSEEHRGRSGPVSLGRTVA